MRGVQRSTSLVLVVSTLLLSALAGLVIPLASGGQPEAGQEPWTPPAETPTSTATVALASAPAATAAATSAPAAKGPDAPATTRPMSTATSQNTQPAKTPGSTTTPSAPASPTATVPGTSEPAPTSTPTQTPQPPVSASPAGGTPQAQVSTDLLNLRASPGTDAQVVGIARGGDRFAVLARSADAGWLQVCCWNNAPIWLASTFVTVTGSIASLPVVP